jgi:response regulator RpfG family c-di-GMP phosphodiesterase
MPARILLVDDEDGVLRSWEKILKPLKHQIVTARDEEAALLASREHPFDLVIIDYLIPPRTGVEILAALRRRLPVIRSILISGRFDEKLSRAELREMVRGKVEVDEYLHKPVSPKILRETVTRLLEGKSVEWKDLAMKTRVAMNVSDQDTTELKSKLSRHLKHK